MKQVPVLQSLKYISRGSQMPLKSGICAIIITDIPNNIEVNKIVWATKPNVKYSCRTVALYHGPLFCPQK